jgi:hypothetical protein
MPGLSPDKIEMLRGLVAASPDEVVRSLARAIGKSGGDSPLSAISDLVQAESADRGVRFQTLRPVAALFGPDRGDGARFPRGALNALWRAMKEDKPDWVKQAVEANYYIDPSEPFPGIFDLLCSRAASQLKTSTQPGYRAVRDLLQADHPGSAAVLILALEITPVVRPALMKMPEWLQRMDDQRQAAARLAYRDAGAVGEGGGPLMFEMLASHLKHPWQILRIISSIMDHPEERYLATSELASFGERALATVQANIDLARSLRPAAGEDQAQEAARAVQTAVEAIAEIDRSIQLAKDGPWGQRLSKLRHALAGMVEQRLKEIDEAVAFVLPMQKVRISGRLTANAPKMDSPPDEAAFAWATGLLNFCEGVRGCAQDGGFGGARIKVLEAVGRRIDLYVEEVVDLMRLGDIEDEDRAREYLEVAAQLMTQVRDRRAGVLVRQRAAAAA